MGQCRYISRAKRPPRKKEHFTPRWKGIEPAVPSSPRGDDCFLECERVFGRRSDFGFPFILLGGFSERKRHRTQRRTSFSLSTASKAARPVVVDPGRPSPPREPPLVTLPLGWPNNRLNMMMAQAFFGEFCEAFCEALTQRRVVVALAYIVEGRRRARGRRKRVGVRTCSSDGYDDE